MVRYMNSSLKTTLQKTTPSLHPDDFDNVAQEYIAENNIMIFRSMEILGVDILEDTAGEVKRNHVYVMPSVAS